MRLYVGAVAAAAAFPSEWKIGSHTPPPPIAGISSEEAVFLPPGGKWRKNSDASVLYVRACVCVLPVE